MTGSPTASAPNVVTFSVCGMTSTEKVSPSTSLTVSDTPSSATEPLGAMKRARSCGARSIKRAMSVKSLAFADRGKPISVTGDDMTAELVANFERALEIDPGALAPAADGT